MKRFRLEDETVWPKPDGEAIWSVYHGCPTKEQMREVASMADAYTELLYHPWGTEVSIKKIRMLRRAIMKEVLPKRRVK